MDRNNVMLNGEAKDFLTRHMICMRPQTNHNLAITLYEYLVDINDKWEVVREVIQTTGNNGGEIFYFIRLIGLEEEILKYTAWCEGDMQLYL